MLLSDNDGCEFPDWANDLICDDGNNNAACNFDGGACCQENPQDGWDAYCTVCECLEDGCEYPNYQGDGYCDDGNNNAGCSYDGGDCCPGSNPPSGWDSYCSVCECKEDGGGDDDGGDDGGDGDGG